MPGPPTVAAILLAAGASTRLGRPKQLVRVQGETLLRRSARLACEAGCSPVFVVLGYEADRMRPELDALAVRPLVNPGWSEGMDASLRRGVQALLAAEPQPSAVLLLVCDQPRLTADHLRALLARHAAAGAPITASAYADRAGVPAIFAASLFPQLLQSHGDRGARGLIRSHSSPMETLPWPEGELDLDRPEDLERSEDSAASPRRSPQ